MQDKALLIATSMLKYAPLGSEEFDDTIFEAKAAIIVPFETFSDETFAPFIPHFIEFRTGLMNNVNSQSVYVGQRYVIAKQHAGAIQANVTEFRSVDEIKAALAAGNTICALSQDGMCTPLLHQGDIPYLVPVNNGADLWKQVIIAAINQDLENNCHWDTRGTNHRALVQLVGNKEFYVDSSGIPLKAAVAAFDQVCQTNEKTFDDTFRFICNDRNSFYQAHQVTQGICVSRYADARVFAWHYDALARKRQEEQATDDGLTT